MSNACCVYAIVDREAALPAGWSDTTGLALIPCRELAAVAGPVVGDRTRITTDAVLRHETIVEAVRRERPALPVRFGTVFRDVASVAAALAGHYESLVTDLARVGDTVELSLSALWAPAPDEGAAPPSEAPSVRNDGVHYLWTRAAQLRREEDLKERALRLSRELDRALGRRAIERRVSLLPMPRVALRTAYLVDPGAVAAFRSDFDAVRRGPREERLLLTGPWPPYSFVRQAGMDGAGQPGGRLAQLAQDLIDATRVHRG